MQQTVVVEPFRRHDNNPLRLEWSMQAASHRTHLFLKKDAVYIALFRLHLIHTKLVF